jgi:hypothetical protein
MRMARNIILVIVCSVRSSEEALRRIKGACGVRAACAPELAMRRQPVSVARI